MGAAILATLADELSDLSDPALLTRATVRLAAAVLLTGAVGLEREMHGTGAGVRTHMLVGLGVALVVVAGALSGFDNESVSRVLQGIFAGIGFIGAGAIIKLTAREQVRGLTTAASIWATASIAAAAGLGMLGTAVLGTALALVILYTLLKIEKGKPRNPHEG